MRAIISYQFPYHFPLSNLHLILSAPYPLSTTPLIFIILPFNPIIPHLPYPLFSTIQTHPDNPYSRKAMPTTSSIIHHIAQYRIILLFNNRSHDTVPYLFGVGHCVAWQFTRPICIVVTRVFFKSTF